MSQHSAGMLESIDPNETVTWFFNENFSTSAADIGTDVNTASSPPCSMCENSSLALQDGCKIVCGECGAVQGIVNDKSFEQAFAQTDASSVNPLLPKSTLGTTIAGRSNMKLRIVNNWWHWVYKEKTFYDEKKQLEQYCDTAKLPKSVVGNAINLYKRVSECRHSWGEKEGKYVIVRGVNRKALMAASVYYGAKVQCQPKSPKEIAELFDIKQAHLTRGCKRFLRFIDPLVLYSHGHVHDEVRDFVVQVLNQIKLPQEVTSKAVEMCNNVRNLQVACNHQPHAIAGAIILLLIDLYDIKGLPPPKIKELLGVSMTTITKIYKKLLPWTRILSDKALTCAYLQEADLTLLEDEPDTEDL